MNQRSTLFAIIATLTIGTAFPRQAAGVPCLALLESYKDKGIEHYEELKKVVIRLEDVDLRLLDGSKRPTFQDIAHLESIYGAMAKAKRFRGETYAEVFTKLKEILPQTNITISEGSEPDNISSYRPNAVELKSLYQAVWNRLVAELPKELGLPLIKISYRIQKRSELIEAGKALLVQSEKAFLELFPTTSGFHTFEDFLKKQTAVTANKPERRAAIDMIMSEGVEVVIQRPENARWWTSKIGLHNQHVTGSSQGYKGKAGRAATEATYANMSVSTYSKLDDTVKPVYGHLQPAPAFQDRVRKTASAAMYGHDGYVINLERLRDRISFTYGGDSLNRALSFIPSWERGIATVPKAWDHTFIPWKYRALFADAIGKDTLAYAWSGITPKTASGLDYHAIHGSDYIEVQIFGGGIGMSELAAFEFERTPPAGDFLLSLRQAGLEIRKRATSKTEVWEPDLNFRELKSQQNNVHTETASAAIHALSLREISFKGELSHVLDPEYEWVVQIATKEYLGEFTHRLRLIDANAPERRIHPTIARVKTDGAPFIYQVRVPKVKIHDVGRLYVQLRSEDGKTIVKSNEKNPDQFFVFNALE